MSLSFLLKPFLVGTGLAMFWASYPWWKHWTTAPFSSFPLEDTPLPSLPPETTFISLSSSFPSPSPSPSPLLLQRLCSFLALHFAPTPAHPTLHHTPNSLLGPHDMVLVLVSSDNEEIRGTLRYHFIGTFHRTMEPIYVVDAFCIHPAWRKKGLATVLLAMLRRLANHHGRPHALFLKEGAPLPYPVPPLLSGNYVYRALPSSPSSMKDTFTLPLSDVHAHRWLYHYRTSFPHTLLILPPFPSPSFSWFAYRRPPTSILIGVQDAHQTWGNPPRPIGWVTVWLETPTTTEEDRQTATRDLSYSLSCHYGWLWMNHAWKGDDPEWKEDGPFHWYTYQWATNLPPGRSYGIPG